MEPKDLIGKKIVKFEPLTPLEYDDMGWYGGGEWKIVLEDGTVIIASSDEEGNDGGSFFVFTQDGSFRF